ncbi:SCO2522 family protein [Umezawaea sp. Da 62-37]|uniref:SCO2522 family protein n=1 Tax=Umezawaea sp. Da 62-37 TaxID=3075927 RepID=UPI0028F74D3D|nr:SCO2522 family protein [Umezawaea sp. Da 62-37]WNV88369.1 SCO2522 family protein [Umezawaea sp. Da 62-37]
MTTIDAPVYTEATTEPKLRQVALSHLSVEVGHFYMEDLADGDERIRTQFRRVLPWLEAARSTLAADLGAVKPRLSTCFLIDDYFRTDTSPDEIVDRLLNIAGECGITIDYLAREAGCAEADQVPLAELTAAMLLPEPPVGTTGARPPVQDSGWLCNGERASESNTGHQAMMPVAGWEPPVEFGKRNHSIFLDVELWGDRTKRIDGKLVEWRQWSCPFLASVWQLLRLGALRYQGEPVAQPQPWTDDSWPRRWSDLPAVVQLSEDPAPFAAYRTTSILPQSYLGIEHAVRSILDHLDFDSSVSEGTVKRALKEGVGLPKRLSSRVSHIFVEAPVAGARW